MKALLALDLLAILSLAPESIPAQEAGAVAHGSVFHDLDGDGRRDPDEPGIAGVAVSNGREVVASDAEGRYALAVGEDTALFVIKPRDWMVPLAPRTHLPRGYYLHKPAGSPPLRFAGVAPTGALPAEVDFPLQPHPEPDSFRVICLGDTQTRDQRELDYLAHDVLEELAGTEAAFGLTLGDLVFDDLDLLEPLARAEGLLGVPWFHVLGNHDENYDAPASNLADETFERVFGPSTYAFNWGQVHFIVLKDVMWEPARRRYHAELGERGLAFVRNDLALVPPERLVVLAMHIPLAELRDRAALFEILSQRDHTFSLAAHTHTQYHVFHGSAWGWKGAHPHHELVHGTSCGSWWSGRPDERGIPHATMADGTPNGYSILSFDGRNYKVTWKSAGRPAAEQMRIYAPEMIHAGEAEKTEVIVNVFAGSERSQVELRLGEEGPWVAMERFRGRDPGFERLKAERLALLRRIAVGRGESASSFAVLQALAEAYRPLLGRQLPAPAETGHLWRARLPAAPPPGTYLIHVRERDLFGQVHRACRALRIAAD